MTNHSQPFFAGALLGACSVVVLPVDVAVVAFETVFTVALVEGLAAVEVGLDVEGADRDVEGAVAGLEINKDFNAGMKRAPPHKCICKPKWATTTNKEEEMTANTASGKDLQMEQ